MTLYDTTPGIEAFIARSRLRRAKTLMERKVDQASRRGFKAVLVPLSDAQAMLVALTPAKE